MRILVLTVGGQAPPLITSIQRNKPDRIVFLCSEDSPLTKGSYTQVPDILAKTKFDATRSESVNISEFDSFVECYTASLRVLQSLCAAHPDGEIIADYTGGTKSMSAGLPAAALDCDRVTLSLVRGDRTDLTKVSNGTQTVRLSRTHPAIVQRHKKLVKSFFARYDYPAAASLLEDILRIPELPPGESSQMQEWLTLSRALDLWDRFDHLGAWKLISPWRKHLLEHVKFLQACLSSRRRAEPDLSGKLREEIGFTDRGHGYELVEDLHLNAQRCASQQRFDDAAARLYRAVELLAQTRLSIKYGIDTSDVKLEKLPSSLRAEYEPTAKNGRIALAADKAYELLARLQDPMGALHSKRRNEVRNFQKIRNASILAHGNAPVTAAQYQRIQDFFSSFLAEAFQALTASGEMVKAYASPIQFPQAPPELAGH